MADYSGPERRQDYLKLDAAIEEVQKLHNTAEVLANAVVNAVPRHELVSIKNEIKRDFLYKLYFQAGLTVISLFILFVFFNAKFNSQNNSIKHGHEIILCMQGKTEAQRTGDAYQTARLVCEQTTK